MKIREIVFEGVIESDPTVEMLLDTLEYLKSNAVTDINTLALVSMVAKNGAEGFSYEALLAANEDPKVQNLIKSIDPKKVVFSADKNKVVNNPEPEDNEMAASNAEDIVSDMAKRALK